MRGGGGGDAMETRGVYTILYTGGNMGGGAIYLYLYMLDTSGL